MRDRDPDAQRADSSIERSVELDGPADVGGLRIFVSRQSKGQVAVGLEGERIGSDFRAGESSFENDPVLRSRALDYDWILEPFDERR